MANHANKKQAKRSSPAKTAGAKRQKQHNWREWKEKLTAKAAVSSPRA
ncbi:hypothetical protein [Phytobacter massiliensis]|nr:hypothetical protein [Phytobacter massiliensis]